MNEIEIVKNAILNGEEWLQEFDIRQVSFTEPKDREMHQLYVDIVQQERRQPNPMELIEMTGEFPSGSCTQREFNHAFSRLRDKKVGGVVQHIIHDAYTSLRENSTVQGASNALASLTKRISLALPSGIGRSVKDVGEELKREIDEFEERKKENGDDLIGISTGYDKLDQITEGLQPGQVWIIGARPSGGKTTLTLNIVHKVLLQDKKVTLFSLEMTNSRILSKLVGIHSGESTKRINKAEIPKQLRDKYIDEVATMPLTIYGIDTKHINDIQASISKEVYTNKPDVIVIDYAQRIKTDHSNETQGHNEVADRLQQLSLQYEVPIIVLSQMSNSHLNNRNEDIGAIAYKGAGAYADVANFAYEIVMDLKKKELDMLWEKQLPVPKKLITQKSRDGAGGTVYMLEHGHKGIFEEVSYEKYDEILKEAKDKASDNPFSEFELE